MSTVKTLEITCESLDQTLSLAVAVGRQLKGGEVIELVSDLGGGKTTFVRGLAQGAGSTDRVSSPSFTLTNQYAAGDLLLQHFDFYRLPEPGIMRDELAEIIGDTKSVTIVEWANIVEEVLPITRLTIKIVAISENGRRFELKYPDVLEYLISKADMIARVDTRAS